MLNLCKNDHQCWNKYNLFSIRLLRPLINRNFKRHKYSNNLNKVPGLIMKCPFCSSIDYKVLDSRLSKERDAIRRRRECNSCSRRFTTYEYIEKIPLMIIKKDGRREPFNREKIRAGINKACEKREVSVNIIEQHIDEIERELREIEEKEVPSTILGQKIMDRLHEIDGVAYVRFASVYRDFKDVTEFVSELELYIKTKSPHK